VCGKRTRRHHHGIAFQTLFDLRSDAKARSRFLLAAFIVPRDAARIAREEQQ
jgi:hypothetical protein